MLIMPLNLNAMLVRAGLAPPVGERWWAGIILKWNKEKTSRRIVTRFLPLPVWPERRQE
jgi:hypothetical protein